MGIGGRVRQDLKPRVSDQQPTFAGGYTRAARTAPVDPSQFADITNMRVLANGEIAKRTGLARVAGLPASQINNLSSWTIPLAGTSRQGQILIFQGTGCSVTTVNDAGVIAAPTNLTSITQPTYQMPGVHFRDGTGECLYIPTGATGAKLSKWDGTTYSNCTVGLSLNLAYVWVYNQRLFGVTGADQTLYWSALNNGDTIGDTSLGGGSATIRTYGGQQVLGGFALGGSNIIVHRGALSVFRGLTFDDISVSAGTQGLSSHVGGADIGTWCVVDNVGYLATRDGLYLITGDGGVVPYEQPGRTDPLRELTADRTTGATQIAWHIPTYDPVAREVWFPTGVVGGTARTVAIYSVPRQVFTGNVTIPSGSALATTFGWMGASPLSSSGNDTPVLLFAIGSTLVTTDASRTAANAFVDDLSTPYTSSVRCRRFFCGSQVSTKSFRRVVVTMGSGALGTAAADSTTGAEVSFTTPVGGTVTTTTDLKAAMPNDIPVSGQGAYMDLTVTDGGDTSTGWSVASVAVEAFDMGARGR